MDLKLLNRTHAKNIDIVRDVIIFHCYTLLSTKKTSGYIKISFSEMFGLYT